MLKKTISCLLAACMGMMLASTAFAADISSLSTSRISSSFISSNIPVQPVPPNFVILDFGYAAKPLEGGKTYYTPYVDGSSSDDDKK